MDKKQIDNLEKLLHQCKNHIPDYPIEQRKTWNVDHSLTVVMAFLIGVLFVLIMLLIYTMESGVA